MQGKSARSIRFWVLGAAALVGGYWYSQAPAQRQAAPAKNANKQSPPAKKQDHGKKKPLLAKFMRAKLTASTQILEGLCTEDYDLIVKGAHALNKVSSAEKWRVSNDAMYRQHSAEFRRSVENLLKAARQKKIDSAALAWTSTTLNCIECHRWVRTMLISDAQERHQIPLLNSKP